MFLHSTTSMFRRHENISFGKVSLLSLLIIIISVNKTILIIINKRRLKSMEYKILMEIKGCFKITFYIPE